MGISKHISECVCKYFSKKKNFTKFTSVRFGNVLGSSGSVIPIFSEQISNGGPVTVTDKDATRYFFMTIAEALQLVIQAGAMSKGGKTYILDMGQPVKILDLAKKMINLRGMSSYFNNDKKKGDIEIKFIGLQKGEKIHEQLYHNVKPKKLGIQRYIKSMILILNQMNLKNSLKKPINIVKKMISLNLNRYYPTINSVKSFYLYLVL